MVERSPVAVSAKHAAAALMGTMAMAAIAAREAMTGREFVFMCPSGCCSCCFHENTSSPEKLHPTMMGGRRDGWAGARRVRTRGSPAARVRRQRLERRPEDGLRVVAVHARDEVVRDQLRARGAALVLVRASAESEPVHR